MAHEHTVAAGETLVGIIAKLCDLAQAEVLRRGLVELNARVNGIADPTRLQIGQRITIYCDPSEAAGQPAPGAGASPSGEGGEPASPPPGSGGDVHAAILDCFDKCYERFRARIRDCAGESDADVKRACLEGARDVLRACLELCRNRPPTSSSAPEAQPSSVPRPEGCTDTSARMGGIDVSHHQGDIDFAKVAGDRRCFVFIKATEGVGYVDPRAAQYARDARAAGLLIGYYHFATPASGDAKAEADFFLATLASLPKPDLVPALDLEKDGGLPDRGLTTGPRSGSSGCVMAWARAARSST